MATNLSSIKGILASLENVNDRLVFQYNPTEIQTKKSVDWAEAKVPGGNDVLATFASGNSLTLALNLFFNVYGEGNRMPNDITSGITDPSNKNYEYVEDALAFLARFSEAQATAVAAGRSPGLLVFTLGDMRFPAGDFAGDSVPFLIVRIVSLNVTRSMFDPELGITRRATAELSLRRHVGFPR